MGLNKNVTLLKVFMKIYDLKHKNGKSKSSQKTFCCRLNLKRFQLKYLRPDQTIKYRLKIVFVAY